MIEGIFRDGHPRVTLTLPGISGDVDIEFIVDTGFDGDIALSSEWTRVLDASPGGAVLRALADGTVIACPFYQVLLPDEEGDTRFVQVLELAGNPLLGTTFLREQLLQIEVTEGGEVSASPF